MVDLDMNDTTLKGVFSRVADATGLFALIPPDQLQRGLKDLEAEMLRLSSDVLVAEQRGVALHVAANDSASFPNLYKFHVGLRDILTMELPQPLLDWARALFEKPAIIDGDEIQLALGRIASSANHAPIHRALARLILFEAVRCSMLMIDHVPQASAKLLAVGRESEAFGLDGVMVGLEQRTTAAQKIDELADAEVSWWIQQAVEFTGECRPVTTMLASALLQVTQHAAAFKAALSKFDAEVVAELKQRDELERILKRMNAPDAVLIRNYLGPDFLGEQRLSVQVLQEHHEIALGGRTRNALDQHMDRLKRRMATGDLPERQRPSLVDLIAEQARKELP